MVESSNGNDPSIVEYYKQLKALSASKQRPKVEKLQTFVDNLDAYTGDLKIPVMCAYEMMHHTYKSGLAKNRMSHTRQQVQNMKDSNSVKSNSMKRDRITKISKYDCIPAQLVDCTSTAIKVAAVLFMRIPGPDSLKRDLITAIINDNSTVMSVSNIIDLCKQPATQIRSYINSMEHSSMDEKCRKQMLCALIELSELLKDRTLSKFAMFISLKGYISLILHYMDKNQLDNIAVYDPLINMYIDESVAKSNQENERTAIYNQFKENKKAVVHVIIDAVSLAHKKMSAPTPSKGNLFKPEQKYQYYKGVLNYTRDINTTWHLENGRRYRIQTYNDCLYDVLGSTLETDDGQTKESEMYDKMSWMDRLNLVRLRPNILVEEATGSELNNYRGSSTDITISWFDDNKISCSKTITIKKHDSKKSN